MKAIPITIREKFVCYVGHKIATEAAARFQSVTRQVSIALEGTEYDADRMIQVAIKPEVLMDLINELGILHEKNTGGLHMDMKQDLIASITATAMAEMQKPDEEKDIELLGSIQWFNEEMQKREVEIDTWRSDRITEGRNFFLA